MIMQMINIFTTDLRSLSVCSLLATFGPIILITSALLPQSDATVSV